MLKGFVRDETGAIAPIVAISLFALIAVGGIAFDYARLAAMDSELQNAADQAALAAATQLDGKSDAITRATNAASNLVTNMTRFANDNAAEGTSVTIDHLTFYKCDVTVCDGKSDMTETNDSTEAKFVEVTVNSRRAYYALTPVVGALNSRPMNAVALAGLGSAVCKVPPVMICNPAESTDPDFTFSNYIGTGLKLTSVGNGGGAWAPGNFGYLDTGSSTSNPVLELKQALGWAAPPGNCSPQTGVDTRTGANTPVTHALNTRFDIYDNGGPGGGACPTGGTCLPSINTVKDVVRRNNANSCGIGSQGWDEPNKKYLPTSQTSDWSYNASSKPDSMGYPRDKCHAVSGTLCQGAIGNGDWDRNAYFDVNYGWSSSQWPTYTGLCTPGNCASVKRYDVYKWETDNRDKIIGGVTILANRTVSGGASAPNRIVDYDQPVCAGSGLVPGGSTVDRRRISVAIVNCTTYNVHGGSDDVPVQKWAEVFLVEPSMTRNRTSPQVSTGQQDVYVEVIGETQTAGASGTAGQVVRKDVPYLIE